MREIKFRGLRIDTKEWVYGYLVKDEYGHCYIFNYWFIPAISIPAERFIEVVPESVSQYTGIKDKNGVELCFEDVIQFQNTEGTALIKKVWFCNQKQSLMIGNLTYSNLYESGFFQPSELEFEIIGNIHENPELLTN